MACFLIYDITEEHILDSIIDSIHQSLISKNLRTYPQDTITFADKRYHPDGDKVCACCMFGKVAEWDESIKEYVNESDFVELTDDWEVEIL